MHILITDLLRKIEPGTEHDGLLPPIKTRARFSAVSEGSGSYDALRRMSAAGLVHVAKSPGRSPLVTLLDNGQATWFSRL